MRIYTGPFPTHVTVGVGASHRNGGIAYDGSHYFVFYGNYLHVHNKDADALVHSREFTEYPNNASHTRDMAWHDSRLYVLYHHSGTHRIDVYSHDANYHFTKIQTVGISGPQLYGIAVDDNYIYTRVGTRVYRLAKDITAITQAILDAEGYQDFPDIDDEYMDDKDGVIATAPDIGTSAAFARITMHEPGTSDYWYDEFSGEVHGMAAHTDGYHLFKHYDGADRIYHFTDEFPKAGLLYDTRIGTVKALDIDTDYSFAEVNAAPDLITGLPHGDEVIVSSIDDYVMMDDFTMINTATGDTAPLVRTGPGLATWYDGSIYTYSETPGINNVFRSQVRPARFAHPPHFPITLQGDNPPSTARLYVDQTHLYIRDRIYDHAGVIDDPGTARNLNNDQLGVKGRIGFYIPRFSGNTVSLRLVAYRMRHGQIIHTQVNYHTTDENMAVYIERPARHVISDTVAISETQYTEHHAVGGYEESYGIADNPGQHVTLDNGDNLYVFETPDYERGDIHDEPSLVRSMPVDHNYHTISAHNELLFLTRGHDRIDVLDKYTAVFQHGADYFRDGTTITTFIIAPDIYVCDSFGRYRRHDLDALQELEIAQFPNGHIPSGGAEWDGTHLYYVRDNDRVYRLSGIDDDSPVQGFWYSRNGLATVGDTFYSANGITGIVVAGYKSNLFYRPLFDFVIPVGIRDITSDGTYLYVLYEDRIDVYVFHAYYTKAHHDVVATGDSPSMEFQKGQYSPEDITVGEHSTKSTVPVGPLLPDIPAGTHTGLSAGGTLGEDLSFYVLGPSGRYDTVATSLEFHPNGFPNSNSAKGFALEDRINEVAGYRRTGTQKIDRITVDGGVERISNENHMPGVAVDNGVWACRISGNNTQAWTYDGTAWHPSTVFPFNDATLFTKFGGIFYFHRTTGGVGRVEAYEGTVRRYDLEPDGYVPAVVQGMTVYNGFRLFMLAEGYIREYKHHAGGTHIISESHRITDQAAETYITGRLAADTMDIGDSAGITGQSLRPVDAVDIAESPGSRKSGTVERPGDTVQVADSPGTIHGYAAGDSVDIAEDVGRSGSVAPGDSVSVSDQGGQLPVRTVADTITGADSAAKSVEGGAVTPPVIDPSVDTTGITAIYLEGTQWYFMYQRRIHRLEPDGTLQIIHSHVAAATTPRALLRHNSTWYWAGNRNMQGYTPATDTQTTIVSDAAVGGIGVYDGDVLVSRGTVIRPYNGSAFGSALGPTGSGHWRNFAVVGSHMYGRRGRTYDLAADSAGIFWQDGLNSPDLQAQSLTAWGNVVYWLKDGQIYWRSLGTVNPADTLSLGEAVALETSRGTEEVLPVADAPALQQHRLGQAADAVAVADSATLAQDAHVERPGDSVRVFDSAGHAEIIAGTDSLALNDSVGRIKAGAYAVADSLAIADSLSRISEFTRSIMDALGIGDSAAQRQSGTVHLPGDSLDMGDSARRGTGESPSDNVTVADMVSLGIDRFRAALSGWRITESFHHVISRMDRARGADLSDIFMWRRAREDSKYGARRRRPWRTR